jgi:hypothetical protein
VPIVLIDLKTILPDLIAHSFVPDFQILFPTRHVVVVALHVAHSVVMLTPNMLYVLMMYSAVDYMVLAADVLQMWKQ